jgi:UDP-glucose 4-epimerase
VKILVTGGGGFIGSWIVKHISQNHRVTILDNLSNCTMDTISDMAKKSVGFVKGDITEIDEIEDAFKDQDLVIHLAAQIDVNESIRNPDFTYRVNVDGTRNVLDCCIKNNVQNIIAASSAAVHGNSSQLPIDENNVLDPMSSYGESKMKMEKLLQEYSKNNNLNSISLRLFNVYGEGQTDAYAGVISKFMKKIQDNDNLTIFGDGTYSRDFISVEDIVRGFQKAMDKIGDKKGQCYNIATGVSTSILTLAKIMIGISGRDLGIFFQDAKKGDIPHRQANTSLAKKELGFSSQIILKDGLTKLLTHSS